MEAQAVNKFSEYLVETGFYFVNISSPNKTLFGDTVVPSSNTKKKSTKTDKKQSDNSDDVGFYNSKLSKYFQIVNSIQ